MSLTIATPQVGGTKLSSIAAGSLPYTNAVNVFTVLTGGAGDDGKFLKYTNAGPSLSWAAASVSDIPQNFSISGDISPTSISSNQNDYNPTSLSTSTVLRLTSDASRNITGLAGGADGRVILILNVGSNNIVLKNQDAGSTAANRFLFPGSTGVTIQAEDAVTLWYDSTTSRWRGFTTHFGKLPIARGGTNSGTTLNNNRIMVSSAGAIVEAGAMTNGQLLIGSTGAAPVVATLTAGSNITITNAAGSITIASTGGGTSPFSATGGVITYTTATDRLRLDIDEVGDIGLEIRGRASLTANYIDIKTLTTDTQPIVAVNSAGRIALGAGGSTATDCLIYRTAANTIQVDHLRVAGTATSGGAVTVQVSAAAHTAVTAESIDLRLVAHTITVTGAITTQRFTALEQPTITAASALTVTNAATLAVADAPLASGSAVITNTYSIWAQAGRARFDGTCTVAGSVAATATLKLAPTNTGSITAEAFQFTSDSHTVTITGGYATQRFNLFNTPTITAGSSLTITNAATLAVAAAPAVGGSAVITNAYSIWAQAGRARFDGSATVAGTLAATALLQLTPTNTTSVTAEVYVFNTGDPQITITGGYTFQRFTIFKVPIINASSTQTITNAATVQIGGPPSAIGSAVITNNYALWVDAGRIRAGGGIVIAGEPAGESGMVGYSNTVDNSANSTGVGTIKFKGATLRDSSGFLKILDGTTARFIPYFDAITG